MNSKGESKKVDHATGVGDMRKITPVLEEQTVVTYVTVPPDGGWGWVIVVASFVCNFLVDGIVYSAGVFIGRIDRTLGVPTAEVSLMGSLLAGCCLMSGPFASALANRYGFRIVSIVGSVIACIGFTAAGFADNIKYLCFTYGFIGGVGFGLIYVPAVITVGFYFEKWRSLATGIAVCGSGIGTLVIAPFTSYLIDNYGWRNAIFIQAGLIFNCAVCGALFRPLMPIQVTVPCDEEEEEEEENDDDENEEENRDTVTSNKLPLLLKIKHAREELKRTDSKLSFDNEVSITAQPPPDIKRYLKACHNTKYATVHEVLNESRDTVQNLFKNSNSSLNKTNEVVRNKGRFDIITYKDKKINGQVHYSSNQSNGSNKSKLSDNAIADFPDDALLAKHLNRNQYNRRASQQTRFAAAVAILEASDIRRNSISLRYHPHQGRVYSESSPRNLRNRRATISSGVRPFYRDDIFFQANPSRLPQYSSKGSGLEYTMAVTRLPTFNDVLEEESSQCTLCPEAVQRTLATMLDFSLLTSPTFLVLCISGFTTMLGLFIPFMYLEERAKKKGGMDPHIATYLISCIGLTNTVGRILCGIVTNLPQVNALLINNLALIIGGVATILSGISMSTGYQFLYASVFGLSMAAFGSLRSIIIVDLIGMEKLTNGFGLLLMFQGVATVIGSPLGGYLKELIDDYNITFIVAGSLIVLSGLICCPIKWINKWENNRNTKNEARDAIRDQVV